MISSEQVSARETMRGRIVDLAISGEIEPGSLTSESEIAGHLKEGRTPVREALALLASEGIFQQVPQKGITLRPIVHEEVEKILAMRTRLEGLVIEDLATNQNRQSLLQPATEAFGSMMSSTMNEPLRFEKSYAQFHIELALAAGYRTAAFSLRSYLDRLRIYTAVQARIKAERLADLVSFAQVSRRNPLELDYLEILLEDAAVLKNVEQGDERGAGKALAQHIRETGRRLSPGNPPVRNARSATKLLLKSARFFTQNHASKATNLAVGRLADLCIKVGKFQEAAQIIGTPFVQQNTPQDPTITMDIDILRKELGSQFNRAYQQGNQLRDLEAIQSLLAEE